VLLNTTLVTLRDFVTEYLRDHFSRLYVLLKISQLTVGDFVTIKISQITLGCSVSKDLTFDLRRAVGN